MGYPVGLLSAIVLNPPSNNSSLLSSPANQAEAPQEELPAIPPVTERIAPEQYA